MFWRISILAFDGGGRDKYTSVYLISMWNTLDKVICILISYELLY